MALACETRLQATNSYLRLPAKPLELVLPDKAVSTTDANHPFQHYLTANGIHVQEEINSHIQALTTAIKEYQKF